VILKVKRRAQLYFFDIKERNKSVYDLYRTKKVTYYLIHINANSTNNQVRRMYKIMMEE
jgi:hypothetical protein